MLSINQYMYIYHWVKFMQVEVETSYTACNFMLTTSCSMGLALNYK